MTQPEQLSLFNTDHPATEISICPVELGRILQDSISELWETVDLHTIAAPLAHLSDQLPPALRGVLDQLAASMAQVEDQLYGVQEAATMLLEILDTRPITTAAA